jgi:hypothetical protein
VTVYDAIGDELPFLRAEAEARMVDTFEISVETGETTQNPDTGSTEPVMAVLFTTPGYIPPSAGVLSQSAEAGGRTVLTSRREIRIPWDSDAVPARAIAKCIAISAMTPPRMLNKQYRVGGSDGASQGTACHLEIDEELS